MKAKKLISKGLALCFILNSFSVLSYANTEIPNRYQTLEGEYITIDDSTEGNLEEIEIFGNTVQDPNNLKDIQSVGDLYVDNEGNPILDKQGRKQYKIGLVSIGKNLFNGEIERGFIHADTGAEDKHSNEFIRSKNFIEVIPNKQLFISNSGIKNCGFFMFYDKNRNFISSEYVENTKNAFTPSNCFYIKLRWHNYGGLNPSDVYNVMLSYANESFEPYQKSELTILSPTPLEKVGDVADKIVKKNGIWGVEKNIKTVKINSNSNIIRHGDTSIYTAFKILLEDSEITYDRINSCISDFLPTVSTFNEDTSEGMYIDENKYLYIGMYQTRNLKSANDFKLFIGEEGFTLKYKLKISNFIPFSSSQKIKVHTYNEKTYIYVNSENGINPTLKVTIDRLPQIAKEAVTQANTDSNIYNISLARMYINMLSESLYKDQLQSQLNDVFSSEVVLEKKSATANVDLYIKSENILQISLNTNFITFDDFSGVEDITKENAVQISINSSLPYSLNVYLPIEIQNSDKSNTMNKDIFNIKENSETTYQTFSNINEKLILKDNNPAGNYLSHGIDIKLKGNIAHEKDVYKTTIKFEAQQK